MKVKAIWVKELPGLPDEEGETVVIDSSKEQDRQKAPWLFVELAVLEAQGAKLTPGDKLYPYARGAWRILEVMN